MALAELFRSFRIGTVQLFGITLPGLLLVFLYSISLLVPLGILFYFVSWEDLPSKISSDELKLLKNYYFIYKDHLLLIIILIVILSYIIGYIIRLSTPDDLDQISGRKVLRKMVGESKNAIEALKKAASEAAAQVTSLNDGPKEKSKKVEKLSVNVERLSVPIKRMSDFLEIEDKIPNRCRLIGFFVYLWECLCGPPLRDRYKTQIYTHEILDSRIIVLEWFTGFLKSKFPEYSDLKEIENLLTSIDKNISSSNLSTGEKVLRFNKKLLDDFEFLEKNDYLFEDSQNQNMKSLINFRKKCLEEGIFHVIRKTEAAVNTLDELIYWPYSGRDSDKLPYFFYKRYLEKRGLEEVAQQIKWMEDGDKDPENEKRSKTHLNLMKAKIRYSGHGEFIASIDDLEANIRLMFGTWKVIQMSYHGIFIGLLLCLFGFICFPKGMFLISFITNVLLFTGVIWGKMTIEKLFHYRRVNELTNVVNCYYLLYHFKEVPTYLNFPHFKQT